MAEAISSLSNLVEEVANAAESSSELIESGEKAVENVSKAAEEFGENGKTFGEGILGEGSESFNELDPSPELVEETSNELDKLDEEIDVAKKEFLMKIESEDLDSIEVEEGFNNHWMVESVNKGELTEEIGPLGEEIGEDFTEEEMLVAEGAADEIYTAGEQNFSEKGLGTELGENYKDFESFIEKFEESDEHEKDREAMQLLLRIGIKLGTKIAVSLAKQIARDQENSKEVRYMAGIFADFAQEGGSFADKMITGESKPDLAADVMAYIGRT